MVEEAYVETLEPNLVKDRTDIELPVSDCWRIETLPPILVKLLIERLLPSILFSRIDAEPPTLTNCLIDIELARAVPPVTENLPVVSVPVAAFPPKY
jgi:hypothetical protein